MKPIPANAQIQNLIASHPHGVKGPPLAVAWSTHRPDTLVIIDTLGHKLIFENPSVVVNPATSTSDNIDLPPGKPKPVGARQASPASKPPNKPNENQPGTPNKPNENQPGTPNKPVNVGATAPNKLSKNQLITTNKTVAPGQKPPNKKEPGSPKPPNKPKP